MPKVQCCWQSEGDEGTSKIGKTEGEVELMYNTDDKSEGKGEREGGREEGGGRRREPRLRQRQERGENMRVLRIDLMHSENVCVYVCECVGVSARANLSRGMGKWS